jgi:hypothetical protein
MRKNDSCYQHLLHILFLPLDEKILNIKQAAKSEEGKFA